MADLKTTYKDDLLNTSVNEKRKYNMIQNADGTVSFEDVTTYSQIGDSFGAVDINATNKKVNEVNSNLEEMKTYSSEETTIGKWIDGKTIYRTFIQKDIPSNSNAQFVNIKSLNISEIVRFNAVTHDANGYIQSGTYTPFFSITIDKNKEYIDILKYSSATGNMRIVIEYTKNAD